MQHHKTFLSSSIILAFLFIVCSCYSCGSGESDSAPIDSITDLPPEKMNGVYSVTSPKCTSTSLRPDYSNLPDSEKIAIAVAIWKDFSDVERSFEISQNDWTRKYASSSCELTMQGKIASYDGFRYRETNEVSHTWTPSSCNFYSDYASQDFDNSISLYQDSTDETASHFYTVSVENDISADGSPINVFTLTSPELDLTPLGCGNPDSFYQILTPKQ